MQIRLILTHINFFFLFCKTIKFTEKAINYYRNVDPVTMVTKFYPLAS